MCRPSGDHEGCLSADPELRVRLRTTPCSAGRLKISPRASSSARLPDGEMVPPTTFEPTLATRGNRVARSVTTCTSTGSAVSVARSIRYSRPPFSNTMSSGPMAGKWMSKSVKKVTWRTLPVARSWAQMLARKASSRSERKYSVEPCHIGCPSLASSAVRFRAV